MYGSTLTGLRGVVLLPPLRISINGNFSEFEPRTSSILVIVTKNWLDILSLKREFNSAEREFTILSIEYNEFEKAIPY